MCLFWCPVKTIIRKRLWKQSPFKLVPRQTKADDGENENFQFLLHTNVIIVLKRDILLKRAIWMLRLCQRERKKKEKLYSVELGMVLWAFCRDRSGYWRNFLFALVLQNSIKSVINSPTRYADKPKPKITFLLLGDRDYLYKMNLTANW